MNCWRCGEPTEHGAAECDACSSGFRFRSDDVEEQLQKIEWMEIDWDKITTFEQMKTVLKTVDIGWIVQKGSPEAQKIAQYLKPMKREDEP